TLVLVSIFLLVIIDCSEGWRRRRRRRRAPTPVNCQVGSWTNWGACSVSCGSGTQARTRAVTVSPANGGAGCPATTEYKSCNIQKQNCQVSHWSFWGTCSKSCGAGTQSRSRTVTVSPANCGSACPPLQDSKACTGIQCPAHCQVSAWTTWSDCSVSCGAGSHSRTRSITIHPVHGGDSCPALTEHDACQVPQIHCAVSSWSSWGTCSESCGPGAQSRSRKVTISPANCGSACPPLQD
uniref:Spondin-like TSP1 domain-containing protein n=1 Tax=Ciona savignyi TaxID=51511 RepID=H2ZLG8_CIOSA